MPLDHRLVAVAGALFISLTAIFTKLAGAPTATVLFYRCLIAGIALAGLAWFEWRQRGGVPARTLAWQALGGALLGLDLALWTQSITYIGAGIATILNNVQVIVVPVLARLIFGERIPLRFLVAAPLMLAGLALAGGALGADASSGSDPFMGAVLGLASGVAYAGYILIVGRSGGHPSLQVLVATIAAGIVGTALGGLWGGIDWTPGWPALAWLAALALIGHVAGWVLLGMSLPALPAQVGASLLLLQPVLAVVFAMLLLGERPTAWQLLGCVIVVGVIGLVALGRGRSRG